jgi:AcrR family transcriptional regulator
MIAKKQRVIQQAYHLFIENGVKATSIQDIIEYSGISKGTFYNYFSSKNELLIEVCGYLFGIIEQERNELLIGRDKSDVEIFIRQLELQLKENKAMKLFKLLDEMFHQDDQEVRRFMHQSQLRLIRWLYERFIDIFGEHRKPVLLDCSIMFMGMLNYELRFNEMYNKYSDIGKIVRYCVQRIRSVVEEVAESGEQLVNPDILDRQESTHFQRDLERLLAEIREKIGEAVSGECAGEVARTIELLDFVEEELLQSGPPRFHLLECALSALQTEAPADLKGAMEQLGRLAREARRTCGK